MKLLSIEKNEPSDEQIYSLLSFSIMVVLVGIPLWWKTTEVYRVALPYPEIDELHELDLKIQLNIHIATLDDAKGEVLIKELRNMCMLSKVYDIHFKQQSIDKIALGSSKTLKDIEKKIRHPNFSGSLQLFEVPGLNRFTASKVIIGENRTVYFSSETSVINLYNFIKEKVLCESFLLDVIQQVKLPVEHYLNSNNKHKIPLSNNFDLLFSVINPDPDALDIVFNISEAIEEYIYPLIQDFEDLNNFHIKSQWLYFVNLQTQLKFLNYSDKGPHFAIPEELLPLVITPLEKKLTSHLSMYPCLNFVLYVTPCSLSPVIIYNKNKVPADAANAFISPKWGGIQIYNPEKISCLNKSRAVVKPNKTFIMSIFLQQLRLLLGINKAQESEDIDLVESVLYLKLWEKDSLFRIRTVEQITSAKLTLQVGFSSLSKLLGKINNIVINNHVGEAIFSALNNIYEATEALKQGKLVKAHSLSKNAFLSSETAFTDPSLLALLYFPDDQKYAVYIPLFLPIMIPIIISLRHIKQWMFKKLKKVD